MKKFFITLGQFFIVLCFLLFRVCSYVSARVCACVCVLKNYLSNGQYVRRAYHILTKVY